MKLERLASYYSSTAILLLNTLVLFIVLNVGAVFILSALESFEKGDPVSEKYGENKLKKVYPHLTEMEVAELLRETWARPYVYEPFTQFKENEFKGKYVNVSPDGYRMGADQAPWPPPRNEFNVFVFGGSTVFGYGVEDAQTITSHFQKQLRNGMSRKVNVYNFGRGFYFSTQERVLFETLVSKGHVPNLAIFIDGLNDFYHYDGRPLYTDRFESFVSEGLPKSSVFGKLPIARLLTTIYSGDEKALRERDTGIVKARYDDPAILNNIIQRYVSNKKMVESVAASFGIKIFFVWQPVPTFGYDLNHHLFAGEDFAGHTFSQNGYPLMKEYLKNHPQGSNFLWAADLQKAMPRPLYVDQVHYSAEFSGTLAGFMAENLLAAYPELSNLESKK